MCVFYQGAQRPSRVGTPGRDEMISTADLVFGLSCCCSLFSSQNALPRWSVATSPSLLWSPQRAWQLRTCLSLHLSVPRSPPLLSEHRHTCDHRVRFSCDAVHQHWSGCALSSHGPAPRSLGPLCSCRNIRPHRSVPVPHESVPLPAWHPVRSLVPQPLPPSDTKHS